MSDTSVNMAHGMGENLSEPIKNNSILQLSNITVSFDGFRALNDLTLTFQVNELRCIIGPNGAGKTTMMDVITGKTRADSGTVFFNQTILKNNVLIQKHYLFHLNVDLKIS